MGRPTSFLLSSLASFRFWLAQKRFRANRDYLVERGYNDIIRIKIIRGKYNGVVFTFHDIRLNEEQPLIDFETHVMSNPGGADLASKKFNRLVSNIFRALLREVLNETRTGYTSESDEERELYEESSPLLEKRILRRKSRKEAVRTDSDARNEL